MIASDARAFQSILNMQIFDLKFSNFNLGVRHILTCAICLDLYSVEIDTDLIISNSPNLRCYKGQV